jgi:hypothetical protein
MATKLGKRELPKSGIQSLVYMGRPANDQGDFGSDVGLADMACVNQFGEANNSKFYHGGVIKDTATGTWYVYLEWGRMSPNKSWDGNTFSGSDFQFVECYSESDAREFFRDQMSSKNTKRLTQQMIGSKMLWTAKAGKDGYLVQRLATRIKGLPDATKIKSDEGLVKPVTSPVTPSKKVLATKVYQPQVLSLAKALVGGVQTYTRSLAQATGIIPTMSAIIEVRDDYIPAALSRLAVVGNDSQQQVRDSGLIAVSKAVASLVPRPIPRSGINDIDFVLNSTNIFKLQQDLDTFEAALMNESFDAETKQDDFDPDTLLNAKLRWLDPKTEGKWIIDTFLKMTGNRHHNVSGLNVKNIFAVSRADRDTRFEQAIKEVASKRSSQSFGDVLPKFQPTRREDETTPEEYKNANVFMGIHGTRSVNIHPIMSSHFRNPKSLSGVQITGAAFGAGTYFATDFAKSCQYVGHRTSYYGAGGTINSRGNFMFLSDVIGGKFHYPRSAGTLGSKCPNGEDSVFAHPKYVPSLYNDEHVIFNPDYARIRYLVEVEF